MPRLSLLARVPLEVERFRQLSSSFTYQQPLDSRWRWHSKVAERFAFIKAPLNQDSDEEQPGKHVKENKSSLEQMPALFTITCDISTAVLISASYSMIGIHPPDLISTFIL